MNLQASIASEQGAIDMYTQYAAVNGHWDLPGDGRQASPLTAT